MNPHSQNDDQIPGSWDGYTLGPGDIGNSTGSGTGNGAAHDYGTADGNGFGPGEGYSVHGIVGGYGYSDGHFLADEYGDGGGCGFGNYQGGGRGPKSEVTLSVSDPDLWILWSAEQDLTL